MTDSKKAEEYVIKKHNIDMEHQPIDFCLVVEFAEDIADFLAGLAEGRKENFDVLICEQEHVEMLEKENLELKEKCERKTNALVKLIEQNEKMKCCGNCRKQFICRKADVSGMGSFPYNCKDWELAE